MNFFTVRPVEKKDLDIIMYLENICFVSPWGIDDIKREIEGNPVSNLWVIENDNSGVVGFIDYWITFDSATICQICVNPIYRQRGLGLMLIEEMIKDCKANRVRNITLEVREKNAAAINLYNKCGFKKALLKEGYYTNGDNAIYMIKELEV